MKFSIKDFFSKCDQTRSKLRIWSHLLKKYLMENFIFYAVYIAIKDREHLQAAVVILQFVSWQKMYCFK